MNRRETGARTGAPTTTLVCMPWHALARPSLALGLLSAACHDAGLPAPAEYHGGLRFADFLLSREDMPLSTYDYTTVAETGFPHAIGDWVFGGVLNGPDFGMAGMATYLADQGIPLRTITAMRALAVEFVEIAAHEVLESGPSLVGFSTTFMQNVPSLALAKRIKQLRPDVTVLLGGGNCDGPMGAALHREFGFVDLVLRGEADETFPLLLKTLGDDGDLGEVPGLCWRTADSTSVVNKRTARLVPPARMLRPDYGSWFAAYDKSLVSSHVEAELVVESARGCWWGEHHHCTFCGLNGTGMTFRAKPPETFAAELEHLVREHQILDVTTVDNILEPGYLRSALPDLSRKGWDLRLHYEVKANLTRDQVATLRDAGVYSVQPGIESLVDDVLVRMDKGVKAVRNVRTLRDCESVGLTVGWNWLYGFPGELMVDYRAVLDQLPALVHLQPPDGVTRIQLQRFSPYFENPALGFSRRDPARVYQHVYDLPQDSLRDMVYMFDTEPRGLSDQQAESLEAAIQTWGNAYPVSSLVRRDIDGAIVLRDRRLGWPHEDHVLTDPREQRAWTELEYGRSERGLAIKLSEAGMEWDTEDIRRWLAGLRERGLVFVEGGRFIALPTTSKAPRPAMLLPVLTESVGTS
jgi:ribosomal peptide maturation radical SAM protein 1